MKSGRVTSKCRCVVVSRSRGVEVSRCRGLEVSRCRYFEISIFRYLDVSIFRCFDVSKSRYFDVSRSRDSVGIRTQDPQLRRLLLYPTELRNHPFFGFCGCKSNYFLFTHQILPKKRLWVEVLIRRMTVEKRLIREKTKSFSLFYCQFWLSLPHTTL